MQPPAGEAAEQQQRQGPLAACALPPPPPLAACALPPPQPLAACALPHRLLAEALMTLLAQILAATAGRTLNSPGPVVVAAAAACCN